MKKPKELKELGISFCAGYDSTIPCKILKDKKGNLYVSSFNVTTQDWSITLDGLINQSIEELIAVAQHKLQGSNNILNQ